MIPDNIQRAFIKPDDTATIVCPECQLAKTVAVGKFRATNRHKITARCTCGHSFPIILDFRRHYRKSTYLPGIYKKRVTDIENRDTNKAKRTGCRTMQAPSVGDEHIMVTNISNGGLQFTARARHGIEVGQEAQVTLTLDDRKHTEICQRVIVQSVAENIIGCRFADNEPLGQALRFYLFP